MTDFEEYAEINDVNKKKQTEWSGSATQQK